MKNMLRATGIVTILTFTALSSVNGQAWGTCQTRCRIPGTLPLTIVNWTTSESICCSGTVNPCPAGSTPLFSSYTSYGGVPELCGPQS